MAIPELRLFHVMAYDDKGNLVVDVLVTAPSLEASEDVMRAAFPGYQGHDVQRRDIGGLRKSGVAWIFRQ